MSRLKEDNSVVFKLHQSYMFFFSLVFVARRCYFLSGTAVIYVIQNNVFLLIILCLKKILFLYFRSRNVEEIIVYNGPVSQSYSTLAFSHTIRGYNRSRRLSGAYISIILFKNRPTTSLTN